MLATSLLVLTAEEQAQGVHVAGLAARPSFRSAAVAQKSWLVDDSVLDHRLLAQLCSFFGVVAALLAGIGIYGVISYGVNRRTSEFGIRMALGAAHQDVVGLVLREALRLVLIGVGIGVAL